MGKLCMQPQSWNSRELRPAEGNLMEVAMKTIALIAHDGKKVDMVAWATLNRSKLNEYHLVTANTTGKLLEEKVVLCQASIDG